MCHGLREGEGEQRGWPGCRWKRAWPEPRRQKPCKLWILCYIISVQISGLGLSLAVERDILECSPVGMCANTFDFNLNSRLSVHFIIGSETIFLNYPLFVLMKEK